MVAIAPREPNDGNFVDFFYKKYWFPSVDCVDSLPLTAHGNTYILGPLTNRFGRTTDKHVVTGLELASEGTVDVLGDQCIPRLGLPENALCRTTCRGFALNSLMLCYLVGIHKIVTAWGCGTTTATEARSVLATRRRKYWLCLSANAKMAGIPTSSRRVRQQ